MAVDNYTPGSEAEARPGPVDSLRHQTVDGSGQEQGRSRLDKALSTARGASTAVMSRRGIPGLRKELFPAAAWRRELDSLELSDSKRTADALQSEDARVTHSLAHLRAEDILDSAREQARRLVGAAAAVARARREQADRAVDAVLAQAEKVAAETLVTAEEQAAEVVTESGIDASHLNERLSKLRTALGDAEARLGAFSASTRRALASRSDTIDLEKEQRVGDLEAAEATTDAVETEVMVAPGHANLEADRVSPDEEIYTVPAPRITPKGRYTTPGLTPDRIEALRAE